MILQSCWFWQTNLFSECSRSICFNEIVNGSLRVLWLNTMFCCCESHSLSGILPSKVLVLPCNFLLPNCFFFFLYKYYHLPVCMIFRHDDENCSDWLLSFFRLLFHFDASLVIRFWLFFAPFISLGILCRCYKQMRKLNFPHGHCCCYLVAVNLAIWVFVLCCKTCQSKEAWT